MRAQSVEARYSQIAQSPQSTTPSPWRSRPSALSARSVSRIRTSISGSMSSEWCAGNTRFTGRAATFSSEARYASGSVEG